MNEEGTKRRVIRLHDEDNVLVALDDLQKGSTINFEGNTYYLKDNIKGKHKFFTSSLKTGDPVIMYGILVGRAQCSIEEGTLMTTDNLKHDTGEYSYRHSDYNWTMPDITKFLHRTFNGYKRSNGKTGTANYWLFIPTVFCENRNLDVIKQALNNELGYSENEKYTRFTQKLLQAYESGKDIASENVSFIPSSSRNLRVFKNVDGIKFLNHSGGCGGTRQDAATLSELLVSYADHPNVGGVTVLSLGCQHLQIQDFLSGLKKRNPSFDKPLFVFEQQQLESEELLIANAIKKTFEGLIEINKLEREAVPVSELCIGVKCGGSDGFSGISANPAVGYASDLLVTLGGKVLLAEFPELNGVEQNLIDRCTSEMTARKFIHLIQDYQKLASRAGSGFHMNPSPGNIRDGLITDAIKSAGAVKKGGSSPVVDVLDYTESAIKPGLSLVCTPGNDVESTTGLTSSGATLILFTTGLGTPTGNPICPTIKLATNSELNRRMSDIIDIDCGQIISGEKTIEEIGEFILDYCIKAASGEIISKAVQLGQDDFIPWKRGVSL